MIASGYQALPTNPPNTITEEGRRDDSDATLRSLTMGESGTKRSLQERHLSMIALAGMIGTGLFLSSGKALAQAGPLGCVTGFIVMGTVTASIAYCSAEMSAFKPVEGGFVRHSTMWLDKSAGITLGWNFWYTMSITMPTEISAAATLIGFWSPGASQLLPITAMWITIIIINLSPVSVYGEFEFYLAFCKIALILSFIIGGLILDLGGFSGQERIGFRYWRDPYPLFREHITTGFLGYFLAFWTAMTSAAFAYGNVQVVAIAGAETQNPRKSIPDALKKTFARVVFFYVASIFVISLTVPSDDERLYHPTGDVTHSPFVIAFSKASLKALPSVINAVVLSSAFSSGNSCSFLASRTLHALALDGHAPSIFLELNRYGVPYVAVGASVVWGVVAYASLSHGAFQAFLWLVSLATTSGIISWVVLCWTYLRFFNALKVQNISRNSLPYSSPWQPYITYYALVMNILILLFAGWNSFFPKFNLWDFMTGYFNSFFFPMVYMGCKAYFTEDPKITLDTIDFATELNRISEEDKQYQMDRNARNVSTYDRTLNAIF